MEHSDGAGRPSGEASDPASLSALNGLEIIEVFGPASTSLGQVAVSFTGMLAARLGAKVLRADSVKTTEMRSWPPLMPDDSSALSLFLSFAKESVPEHYRPSSEAYLLTDDAGIASAWPGERKVLIRPSSTPDGRWQSELTAMAASGLLDIVSEEGRPPLPLPGHQVAYAAGLAALAGLLASHHMDLAHGEAVRVETAAVEVAAWLNWKNRLSSVSGNRQTGRRRQEEWLAVRCRDGYIAVIFRDRDIPALAKLMRSPRLAADIFQKEPTRLRHLAEFHTIVATALADRGKDELLKEAGDLGLQFSAVLSPTEMFDDPQMKSRQFFSTWEAIQMPRLPLLWRSEAMAHPLHQRSSGA